MTTVKGTKRQLYDLFREIGYIKLTNGGRIPYKIFSAFSRMYKENTRKIHDLHLAFNAIDHRYYERNPEGNPVYEDKELDGQMQKIPKWTDALAREQELDKLLAEPCEFTVQKIHYADLDIYLDITLSDYKTFKTLVEIR